MPFRIEKQGFLIDTQKFTKEENSYELGNPEKAFDKVPIECQFLQ